MNNNLKVKIVQRKANGQEWYEGSVAIPGLKGNVKLARKSDGNTKFSTRSAVNGAAKSLVNTLHAFNTVDFGQDANMTKPAKKATTKKPSTLSTLNTSSY